MREYEIDDKNAGIKLFNFVRKLTPEIKNSDIFKIIRKGVITINDKKEEYTYKLIKGDVVTFFMSEDYFKAAAKKVNFPYYKLDIVFEDKDLLLINKPRGVLVHSDGVDYKNNLVEYIKGYLYRKGEYDVESGFTPTICNRLDFNTSGIVAAAKNHETLKKVTAQFRNRCADKTYMSIVYGKIDGRILIVSKMTQNPEETNMMISQNTEIIKDIPSKDEFVKNNPELSATLVTPIAAGDETTLVSIELWTGRKHQIRCQLKQINHPLPGDFKYYTVESVRYSNEIGFDGYFLHSASLELEGYGSFNARPDERFMEMIRKLYPHAKI